MITPAEPVVYCQICRRELIVKPDGRTRYPVPLAKRRLRRTCALYGCPCKPGYRPGVNLGGPAKGMS